MEANKKMTLRLNGKAAVVTGGGGGIGRAVCLALAAEGASVVVNDFGTSTDGTKAADKVVNEIKKANGIAVANYDSVATVVSAQMIIDTATSNFGRIDILANCAGNYISAPTVDMTQEQWDSEMAVHLGGHFSCSRAAARAMIKQKSGSIINVSSLGAFPIFGGSGTGYSTAKAGIIGFTAALSWELKEHGIRVNVIFPQATTPLFTGTTPRGRPGIPLTTSLNPEDIAPMFVYLGTDEAKNITGQYIYAAGGDFSILDKPMKHRLFIRKIGRWTVDELSKIVPGLGLE